MGNEEVEKEDCGRRKDIKLEKGSAEALLPEEVTEWFTDLLHNGSKNLACNHQDTSEGNWLHSQKRGVNTFAHSTFNFFLSIAQFCISLCWS